MSETMPTYCRIYKTAEITGRTTEGGNVDLAWGCNGVVHATCYTGVFPDRRGQVMHANPLMTIVTGVCDGSCTNEDRGFFHL